MIWRKKTKEEIQDEENFKHLMKIQEKANKEVHKKQIKEQNKWIIK